MRKALNETTNVGKAKEPRSKLQLSEKERTLAFLREMLRRTKDHSLRYDLSKCVEIVEGKENQEVADLKSALNDALVENETLFVEKCELALKLDELREEKKSR
jgi:hypothetical protein